MIWLVLPALAQDYRFPTSDAHVGYFYPTAYYDHSGVDWACGGIRYSGHGGSDFGVGGFDGMDAGRDLVAAAAGTVTTIHDGEYDRCTTGDCSGGSGYGNHVRIQHADGKTTIYGHMKQWSVAVSEGQSVACGQHLGQVGSSGYSTGPHVHFEVRSTGNSSVDPFDGDCSAPPSYWVSQGSYDDTPLPVCDDPPPSCTPDATLTCGDTVERWNTGTGSESSHSWYGCEEWVYSGSEISFEVVSSLSETVTVSLTGLSQDLDLNILQDATCDTNGCIGASSNGDAESESVAFSATANHHYLAVVDGWEGASSSFTLSVQCEGRVEDEEPEEPEEPEDSAPPVDTAVDSALPDALIAPPGWPVRIDGCGCSQGPSRVPPMSALLLLITIRRAGRRRSA